MNSSNNSECCICYVSFDKHDLICYSDLNGVINKCECKLLYCYNCLQNWRNYSLFCPICKISDDVEEEEENEELNEEENNYIIAYNNNVIDHNNVIDNENNYYNIVKQLGEYDNTTAKIRLYLSKITRTNFNSNEQFIKMLIDTVNYQINNHKNIIPNSPYQENIKLNMIADAKFNLRNYVHELVLNELKIKFNN